MSNLRLSFFLLATSLPLLHGCGSDAVAQTDSETGFQSVEIEVLSSWASGDPLEAPDWDAAKMRVVTNSSDLAQYWSDYSAEATIPDIDFSANTVVMYDKGPSPFSPALPTVVAEHSVGFSTTRVEFQYEYCESEADSVPVHNTHERPVMIFTLPVSTGLFVGETLTIDDC